MPVKPAPSTLQAVVSMKECGSYHSWKDIASHVGETSHKKVRAWYLRRGDMKAGSCPVCNDNSPWDSLTPDEKGSIILVGVTNLSEQEPVENIWERAIALQDRKTQFEKLRERQRVMIPGDGPFAWAWLSDLHPGDGADYRQMKHDAEIIRDTPRMWASFNGDGPNNWIVQKLAHLQRGQELSHDDEWSIFTDWLSILGDKLKVVSLGNHDLWTLLLAGVDRIKSELVKRQTVVLYDDYEVVYDLCLGDMSWRVKQRHQWPGSSVFNPTHGIEVGWQRGGDEFDIGIGSHTHYGTVCRPFYRHEERKYAILIGTYALWQKYGRLLGKHPSMDRGCGAMVFTEDKGIAFFDRLELASEFLRYLWQ